MHKQIEPLESPSSDDELLLYLAFPTGLMNIWDQVEPLLKTAIDYADGKYTTDDIRKYIKHSEMQLWFAARKDKVEGCCITRIYDYPQQRRLGIEYTAGVCLKNWLHFLKPIVEWGKAQGCVAVESYAREGWIRAEKDIQFKKIHTVIRAYL